MKASDSGAAESDLGPLAQEALTYLRKHPTIPEAKAAHRRDGKIGLRVIGFRLLIGCCNTARNRGVVVPDRRLDVPGESVRGFCPACEGCGSVIGVENRMKRCSNCGGAGRMEYAG